MNAGLNQALLGNEVLGYTGALLGSGSAYTLSGLTRGEVSTLTSAHASAERFCTLPGAVRVTVPDALEGATLLVKCVSPYQTLADVVAQSVVIGTKSGGPVASGGSGPSAGSGVTTPIAASGSAGTSTSFAPFDHTHQGVHKIHGSADAVGDIVFTGSGVSQSGNTFDFSGSGTPATTVQDVGATDTAGTSTNYAREDHVHKGVHKIHGTADASGDLVFNGSGVSQSGNTFTFGGGGGMNWIWDGIFDTRVTGETLTTPVPNGVSVPNLSEAVVFTLNNAGADLTFELPSSAAYPIIFKMCDTFTATIHPYHTGSGTIDGASSYTLTGNNKAVCFMPVGYRYGVVDWIIFWTY